MWQHTPYAIQLQTEAKLEAFQAEARANLIRQDAPNVIGLRSWIATGLLWLADRIESPTTSTVHKREGALVAYRKRTDPT